MFLPTAQINAEPDLMGIEKDQNSGSGEAEAPRRALSEVSIAPPLHN